jgi:hypothetical protein
VGVRVPRGKSADGGGRREGGEGAKTPSQCGVVCVLRQARGRGDSPFFFGPAGRDGFLAARTVWRGGRGGIVLPGPGRGRAAAAGGRASEWTRLASAWPVHFFIQDAGNGRQLRSALAARPAHSTRRLSFVSTSSSWQLQRTPFWERVITGSLLCSLLLISSTASPSRPACAGCCSLARIDACNERA